MRAELLKTFLLTLKSHDDCDLNGKVFSISSGLGEVELFDGINGASLASGEYFSYLINTYSRNREYAFARRNRLRPFSS